MIIQAAILKQKNKMKLSILLLAVCLCVSSACEAKRGVSRTYRTKSTQHTQQKNSSQPHTKSAQQGEPRSVGLGNSVAAGVAGGTLGFMASELIHSRDSNGENKPEPITPEVQECIKACQNSQR